MGRNGSYNQIHHHRNLSTSSTSSTTTTTFLPLLCRISTKDVVAEHKKTEPSSPKVSCMGQIKRHNTNKNTNSASTNTTKLRYTQLKKIFSGRNILITTTTTNTTRSNTSYCKANKNNKIEGGEKYHRRTKSDNYGVVVPLNLAELDPPLPVVKSPVCSREGDSLWKRRGGGTPLGGLQIQHIQLPNNNSCSLLITPPSFS